MMQEIGLNDIVSNGLSTEWLCTESNAPSWKIAESLQLVKVKEYHYYEMLLGY